MTDAYEMAERPVNPRITRVDIAERVRTLMGGNSVVDVEGTTVTYSLTMGYERIMVREKDKPVYHYGGMINEST